MKGSSTSIIPTDFLLSQPLNLKINSYCKIIFSSLRSLEVSQGNCNWNNNNIFKSDKPRHATHHIKCQYNKARNKDYQHCKVSNLITSCMFTQEKDSANQHYYCKHGSRIFKIDCGC